ncbi:hypothetical protein FOB22_000253 [Saccharomyces cerevisiae]|nr:hypothetical protein FOB22_000253 [Saccharomyces cerevisiae]
MMHSSTLNGTSGLGGDNDDNMLALSLATLANSATASPRLTLPPLSYHNTVRIPYSFTWTNSKKSIKFSNFDYSFTGNKQESNPSILNNNTNNNDNYRTSSMNNNGNNYQAHSSKFGENEVIMSDHGKIYICRECNRQFPLVTI